MDVKYSWPALFQHGATVEAKKPGPAAAAAAARGEAIEPAGKYLECLRNHAASIGGYVVDGCGEFMPAGGPVDPASLRCAACGCHRSFHRQATAEAPPPPPPLALLPPPSSVAAAAVAPHVVRDDRPPRGEGTPGDRVPGADEGDGDEETDEGSDYDRPVSPLPAPAVAPPPEYFAIPSASQMLFAVSAGAQASGSPASASTPAPAAAPPAALVPMPLQGASLATARKRFRTRFSPEQKERMRALSERLGWRLQKRDVAAVEDCCREIGVTRGVFKVWMHNNKHNFVGSHSARRAATASPDPAPAAAAQPASSHHGATPPPAAAATASAPPPPVHTGFNINGDADSYFVVQPATATGGTPLSS